MGVSFKNFKDKDVVSIVDCDDYRWVFVYAKNENHTLASNYGCMCYPTDEEDSFFFSISVHGGSIVMDFEEIREVDYATKADCENFMKLLDYRTTTYKDKVDHLNFLKHCVINHSNRIEEIDKNGGKPYWTIEHVGDKFIVKQHTYIGSKTDFDRIEFGNAYIDKDAAELDADKLNETIANNRDLFKRTWNL